MSDLDSVTTAERRRVRDAGIGLCLSGGGYRAMLYHVGVVMRLREAGLLDQVQRVSSVSGGSITAGMLALKWESRNDEDRWKEGFVDPLRALASQTIDVKSGLAGILPGRSIADGVEASYRKHLFQDATLQDLPDTPRFIINASNLRSGALFRFSKPYMGDWRVGCVENPTLSLASAVAASSAFPPFLSPITIKLRSGEMTYWDNADLFGKGDYSTKLVLSDGGVYDNLGMETVWDRMETVFISDAGGKMREKERVATFWPTQALRVLSVVDNQVRSLRKRWFFEGLGRDFSGAFWGIRTPTDAYEIDEMLECPPNRTLELADTPTRLAALPEEYQERLVNWGYASCDTSLRTHYNTTIPIGSFPYPEVGV